MESRADSAHSPVRRHGVSKAICTFASRPAKVGNKQILWLGPGRATLAGKQPLFLVEAPRITGELAVGSDHSVAGDGDRDRISAVAGTRGARRARPAETPRELPIGDRRAERNSHQLLPDV